MGAVVVILVIIGAVVAGIIWGRQTSRNLS